MAPAAVKPSAATPHDPSTPLTRAHPLAFFRPFSRRTPLACGVTFLTGDWHLRDLWLCAGIEGFETRLLQEVSAKRCHEHFVESDQGYTNYLFHTGALAKVAALPTLSLRMHACPHGQTDSPILLTLLGQRALWHLHPISTLSTNPPLCRPSLASRPSWTPGAWGRSTPSAPSAASATATTWAETSSSRPPSRSSSRDGGGGGRSAHFSLRSLKAPAGSLAA